MEKVNEFKEFVRSHPGLKDEVSSGKSTWQNLYETWYLYGSDDGEWDQYKPERPTPEYPTSEERPGSERPTVAAEVVDTNMRSASDLSGPEMVAQAFEYLQKIDIDKVQKTMGTFQQFIQIFQTMQGGKGAGSAAAGMLGGSAMPKQNYSGFFSQFDD